MRDWESVLFSESIQSYTNTQQFFRGAHKPKTARSTPGVVQGIEITHSTNNTIEFEWVNDLYYIVALFHTPATAHNELLSEQNELGKLMVNVTTLTRIENWAVGLPLFRSRTMTCPRIAFVARIGSQLRLGRPCLQRMAAIQSKHVCHFPVDAS